MTNTTCSQCGSARLHRSRRRHPLERIVTALGGRMRRCHNCNSRYVGFAGSLLRTTDLLRVAERLALTVAIIIAAALVMMTILWFSRVQMTPSSETGGLLTTAFPRTS